MSVIALIAQRRVGVHCSAQDYPFADLARKQALLSLHQVCVARLRRSGAGGNQLCDSRCGVRSLREGFLSITPSRPARWQ